MEVSTRCNAASGLGVSDHNYQERNVETQWFQTLVSLSPTGSLSRWPGEELQRFPSHWERSAELIHDKDMIMKTESTFPTTHISRAPCHRSHTAHRWWSLVRYKSYLATGKRSGTLVLEGASVLWQHGNVCFVFLRELHLDPLQTSY